MQAPIDARTCVPFDQTDEPLAPVPWLAIAAALHVILLVIAWFVLPHAPHQPLQRAIIASLNRSARAAGAVAASRDR